MQIAQCLLYTRRERINALRRGSNLTRSPPSKCEKDKIAIYPKLWLLIMGIVFYHSLKLKTSMHDSSFFFFFFFFSLFFLPPDKAAYGLSDPSEVTSLLAVKDKSGDSLGKLSNWVGNDPCGTPRWTGVYCSDPIDGVQYVHELRLLNMNFTGTLAPHIGNLTNLTILNFMWNNLSGSVPPAIGKLSNLFLLLLDGNQFTGSLPPELGNLSKLNRLQIDGNSLTGSLPPSFQGLTAVKHIHLNNNSLNGSIPKELGQLPNLVHLLLDNNKMNGDLPPELSNISSLVILQLDNNNFTGGIPVSYTKLLNLTKLSLRNCNLSGMIPALTSLPHLLYLDLSQNGFSGSLPALNSKSQSLTTIDLSFNKLMGEVPTDYLQMLNMELLLLQNNSLNGSIAANQMKHNDFTSSKSVLIVNLQNNNFTEFIPGPLPNVTFRLHGNPVCINASSNIPPKMMCLEKTGSDFDLSTTSTTTPSLPGGCSENTCSGAQNLELVTGLLLLRGQCQCAYPLVVGYRLKSPSFTVFSTYEKAFISYFALGLGMQDYQINVSQVSLEPGPRLRMTIKLFPNNETHEFEQTEVDNLYSNLSSWRPPPNNTFGPYELLFFTIGYPYNDQRISGSNGISSGAFAGILVAAVALTAIVVVAAMFLVGKHRHQRIVAAKSAVRQHERIKVSGVRSFSFRDMSKATNNFDLSMTLGQGGYGKVYKAVLDDGLVVAVKRAEVGSLQGSKEFFTEIELLSRVHHRNLVSLIGYCDDEEEQMLVYEFMAHGNVRDHLNSGSKVPLDFPARLQIAIGAAKGILYLHTEADPPIYHRDIKACNILLDEKGRAKVSDFGLSKLAPLGDVEGEAGGYVSTVVKGTPGYLDPEYFSTRLLTDKSDVYSFGVVLLELVTGRQPIYHGKNLVREVMKAYEKDDVLSMVDPRMGTYPTGCMLPLIQLAVSCSEDKMESRPSMAEVVRVLVSIWQSTPLPDPSMAFSNASMDTQDVNPKQQPIPHLNEPCISSDAEKSGLFSGVNMQLAPR